MEYSEHDNCLDGSQKNLQKRGFRYAFRAASSHPGIPMKWVIKSKTRQNGPLYIKTESHKSPTHPKETRLLFGLERTNQGGFYPGFQGSCLFQAYQIIPTKRIFENSLCRYCGAQLFLGCVGSTEINHLLKSWVGRPYRNSYKMSLKQWPSKS